MLEMKVTITAATDLVAAFNNLAAALARANFNQTGMMTDAAHSSTICADVKGAQPATPTAPVNPTPAQAAQPTAAPAIMPFTAEQTATPIAPTVPVATPAPAVTPAANAAPAPAVPTSAPQYTLDMIATAGSALIDAGKMDQLMGLLGKFGVASLTELAPESYGAVANELRALGAAI